ncbi:SpoIVB peptidase [Barrientosiimonas marina]|uniref:SpoIVB peptidase n=1 Tax=Lentibacillus kimchii TaxID=1542911 RepID=A0ABW2V0J4_9BACI
MNYDNKVRFMAGILFLITVLAIPFISPFNHYFSIPDQVMAHSANNDIGPADASAEHVQAFGSSVFYAKQSKNRMPVQQTATEAMTQADQSALEDVEIVPGGQSLGVQLNTLGVLVVGYHQIEGENGKMSPGEEADVQVGDMILEINGKDVEDMEDVKPFVQKAGKSDEEMAITIKRDNKTFETAMEPAKDAKDKYRIGLYIRDSAAGIGTMSFYDPASKKYGALGHVISDMDTQKPIEIHNGTIVRSNVTAIDKGNSGTPGEKQAKFSNEDEKIGNITKNTPFGVFGELNKSLSNSPYDEPMPVASPDDVEEGPAKILTVLEGEEVQEFDVEVVSSVPQKYPAKKGMVIEITDDELLNETGGIVQGMSGSPIIQNDKIIGAVTHVFVNDPTSGYGVHIEWMLQEAGIEGIQQGNQAA